LLLTNTQNTCLNECQDFPKFVRQIVDPDVAGNYCGERVVGIFDVFSTAIARQLGTAIEAIGSFGTARRNVRGM
jgi:hypothetical protein